MSCLQVEVSLMKFLKFSVLLSMVLVVSACLDSSNKAPAKYTEKYGDGVVLYATSWCGYCEKMREFFAEHKIEYREYDVEASNEAMAEFKELGGKGVPLVLVKGRVVIGYAPKTVAGVINSR